MKMFFSISVLLFLIAPVLSGAEEFKQIDQWKHDEVCGREFYSLIDHDNHVVAGFRFIGNRIISPGKLIKFAPYGQGPGDLTDSKAAYLYNSDLAIMENQQKIKIFTKKDGTYVWKETKWLKRGYWADSVKDAVFFDNKLFVVGRLSAISENNQKEIRERVLLKVYGSDGYLLKQLIKLTYPDRIDFTK
ncbi:MAG: hypothetical protein GY950_18500 [bacterium]|nr:hypothetical protein [bacterium]